MQTAFAPAQPVLLPIAGGSELFPVRRIYCIGRNYADHAREMGHDPDREPPFFFQKNPDNLMTGGTFAYPGQSTDVQFEIELVVALAAGGTDVPASAALAMVFGYGVGLDMTRRDLQAAAKKMGRPWDAAKAFEGSAPCSPLRRAAEIGHLSAGAVWLDVNGTRRQTGDLSQMIWTVPEIICELSRFFTLAPGDVIFTGTPAGVGAIVRGDVMTGGVAGVGQIAVQVT
ncbi:MAG: fumarylacetoacetate hydrolase family protein [Hyphomicrobiaceae bacterium]|nr:fumarylacetoacetate hydrolase family protein [Hyphomicrobiaceae bacterium]